MSDDNKKKRILVIHNKYQVRGGEDSVVENEIQMLKHHGHDVFEYIRDNTEMKSYGITKRIRLLVYSIFNPEVYREVIRIVYEKNIDVIHVHNTHIVISPSVFYAAKKCKVPAYFTVHNFRLICVSAMLYRNSKVCEDCVGHGLWAGVRNKCYRNSRIQSLLLAISNTLHRYTGIYKYINFICLSEFNREKLLSINGVNPEKVFVKPNFSNRRKETFGADYQHDDSYYFYFGRIDKTKGIDKIIEAFGKLPKQKLIIAGDGPMFDTCKAVVEKQRLKNINMVGWCDRVKIEEYLRHSKAVVCASQWYEGHPMNVVESFANGVPVIAGDIGNIGAIIDDGFNGIKYNYQSIESLKEAIIRYESKSYKERKQMRINAYNTFVNRYSEEENYKMLMRIYENLHGE